MAQGDDFKKVTVGSQEELLDWLEASHQQSEGVWLVTFKKTAPSKSDVAKYVSTSEVLDALLAYGWIDGFRKKLDERRTQQLIFPRKAQYWSKSYKDRARRLIDEGRMREPGLQRLEEDKASGLWNFLDDVDALVRPPDLKTALKKTPKALKGFDAQAPAAQRFALRWIKLAKTEKTRERRVMETARLASLGKKVPGA